MAKKRRKHRRHYANSDLTWQEWASDLGEVEPIPNQSVDALEHAREQMTATLDNQQIPSAASDANHATHAAHAAQNAQDETTIRMSQATQSAQATQAMHMPVDDLDDLETISDQTGTAFAGYTATSHGRRRRKRHSKKRMSTGKKLAIAIPLVLLGVLLAIALVGGLFVYSTARDMSLPESKALEVSEALAPAPKGNEPFYMLITAIDEREVEQESDLVGRTDTMLLARVDGDNKKVTLVTIPRDTPWINPEGNVHRINDSLRQGGPSLMIKAVQELTGVPISHYTEVNYVGFERLVERLGGVTVTLPKAVDATNVFTGEVYHLEAGEQDLTADEAKALARLRKPYDDADRTRQQINRQMLLDLAKRASKVSPTELPSLVQLVAENIGTDMKVGEMARLAPTLLGDLQVYQAAGPYEGDYNPNVDNLWLCYENPKGWKRLMEAVDAGEDPSGISYRDDPVTVAGTDGQAPETRPFIDFLN